MFHESRDYIYDNQMTVEPSLEPVAIANSADYSDENGDCQFRTPVCRCSLQNFPPNTKLVNFGEPTLSLLQRQRGTAKIP